MMEVREIKSIPANQLQQGDVLPTTDDRRHVVDWIWDEPRGITRVLVEVDGNEIYERRFGHDDPDEKVEVVA
jgi:hypothetical protein